MTLAPPPPPPGWPEVRPPGSGPAAPLDGRDRFIARVELAVIGFATAAPGVVIGLRGISDPTTVDVEIDIITLVASLFAGLGPAAIAIYLLWRDGHLLTAGFARPRPGWILGRGLLTFVSTVGALWAIAIVVSVVLAVLGIDLPERDDDPGRLAIGTIIAALLISIVAGVAEEITFRAYAITRMEQAGWPRAALVVPLVVWTAEHLYQGPVALVIVGTLGVVFVAYFNHYRNVYPLIIGHALYDITIFLFALAVR